MSMNAPLEGAIVMEAPAKLNLYLHVTGRRDNGYHELDSLVAFASVGDRLRVEPAPELSLEIEGLFEEGLDADEENLVWRAAEAVRATAEISDGARMTLTKNLPIASGI
ncbi:MAG: 4-(cytidine 5'-diphospho)-2-C-methyl-D-erythritol kinase, partial [Rhodospirillales bacterium]|nr:4-(cytidine 5'-diphospho)-2-C-methyl-D-erythritol kinase [Rhodospirillales bacterium]